VGLRKILRYIIDTSHAKPSRMYPTTCKFQAMVARVLASQTGFAYRRWALTLDQAALHVSKYARSLNSRSLIVPVSLHRRRRETWRQKWSLYVARQYAFVYSIPRVHRRWRDVNHKKSGRCKGQPPGAYKAELSPLTSALIRRPGVPHSLLYLGGFLS
jgi:hypothetical protein